MVSSVCTVKVREWLEFVLHSYYGSLILDTAMGALLHVGVLMSSCVLWLTQYMKTTVAPQCWKLGSKREQVGKVFMCMSNKRCPLLYIVERCVFIAY